jgi:chromosome segregation ATPase
LSREADRALRLEADLAHVTEDLTNYKLTSQNAEQSLAAANAKLRASELNERELQNHLEVLSHRQDEAKDETSKLEKEKKVLEARVRELDTEVRQLSAPMSGISRKAGRTRSSSVSMPNFKNTAMEQELSDIRASLSAKEGELRTAHEKLGRAQTELVQTQNERIAVERRMKKQLSELEASLEEKEEEIEGMKAQQGDGGREREEELMKRVEEDEAKIMALEMLAGENHKLESVKDALGRAEKQLKVERKKAQESERHCVELIRQNAEAFDKLEQAIQDREARIQAMNMKEK